MYDASWRVFWQNIKSPRLLSPDFVHCELLWAFPKIKITFERKRFQTLSVIQENTMGQLVAIGRTVWGPKVPILKGTEASLSYVQHFLYLLQKCLFFILHGWIHSGHTLHIKNSQLNSKTKTNKQKPNKNRHRFWIDIFPRQHPGGPQVQEELLSFTNLQGNSNQNQNVSSHLLGWLLFQVIFKFHL